MALAGEGGAQSGSFVENFVRTPWLMTGYFQNIYPSFISSHVDEDTFRREIAEINKAISDNTTCSRFGNFGPILSFIVFIAFVIDFSSDADSGQGHITMIWVLPLSMFGGFACQIWSRKALHEAINVHAKRKVEEVNNRHSEIRFEICGLNEQQRIDLLSLRVSLAGGNAGASGYSYNPQPVTAQAVSGPAVPSSYTYTSGAAATAYNPNSGMTYNPTTAYNPNVGGYSSAATAYAVPSPAPAPTGGKVDVVQRLQELTALRNQGGLTEDEFQKAKQAVLNGK